MSKTMCDSDLYRQADMGFLRLDNEGETDSPMLLPPPPEWTKNREQFVRQQRRAMGGAASTQKHYVELLVRATALLEFMHHNVGPTYEWPLTVEGDTEEVEAYFGSLVGSLEHAVGCLTEV